MQTLREHGLSKHSHCHRQDPSGRLRPFDAGKGEVQVWRDAKAVFSAKLADLHQVWDSVSWKICQQRDNPACADAEHAAAGDPPTRACTSFMPNQALALVEHAQAATKS